MADIAMDRCEVKRLYKINGVKEMRWVDVAAADVAQDADAVLRCASCHGAVKFNKGGDYVLHRWRADGDNCQGGRAGQTRSSKPVE